MDPDYVIVGETASYNYEVITKAVRLVLNGASADRDKFRPHGANGIRHCARLPVARRADRAGDGPEGLFYGQAEPAW